MSFPTQKPIPPKPVASPPPVPERTYHHSFGEVGEAVASGWGWLSSKELVEFIRGELTPEREQKALLVLIAKRQAEANRAQLRIARATEKTAQAAERTAKALEKLLKFVAKRDAETKGPDADEG